MENTDNTTTRKVDMNVEKESLLRFMQDADCLESLSKWTNELKFSGGQIENVAHKHSISAILH